MRTKRRPILARVVELVLTFPAPDDYENFWSLVDDRCPHIGRLSLHARDVEAIGVMRIQPSHLSILGARRNDLLYATADASQGPRGSVTHLYLSNHAPTMLSALLQFGCFARLTHFSCSMPLDGLTALRLFLALPALRVFLQRMPLNERRFVVIFSGNMEDVVTGEAPRWTFAEKEIATQSLQLR
ncbi:hypothetical protein B0H19DRAFT_1082067 [Mycena capillaripes]|nr:hypothetical protein B0H19DRAFT_1082067 [Mycena capillaripes]